MANEVKHRNRKQHTYSLRPGVTKLTGYLTIGAGGAIDADGYNLRGLNVSGPAVTRLGTGKYRLRFADKYLGLSGFNFGFEHASSADGYNVVMLDSSKIASDQYVDVQIVNNANAAADANSSTNLWLEFSMKTSARG